MDASAFSLMIEKGHQAIKEASSLLSSWSASSSNEQQIVIDNILDKLDDVLESLRNVPNEPASLTSDSLFSLNSSLNEKHLQWFDLTQQVILSQCKLYLLLLRQDSYKNGDLMNTLEILIRELISIHEWMKRRCISILSNPNYSIERKNEIQTKFLKKSMNDWEHQVAPVLEQISHITIEDEYEKELSKYLQNYLTEDGISKVCVKNKNQQEGKTVLLNCESVNDKELIFREAPICSQIITDSSENPLYRKIDHCHHCMRTIFSEKTISQSPLLQKVLFATTDTNNTNTTSSPSSILSQYSQQQQHEQQICVKTKPISCSHCSLEVFCSEECRDQAWKHYHSLLCTRNSSELQCASSTSEHPMILLERLSVKQSRTAPLMIAKMMAFVVSDVFIKLGLANQENDNNIVDILHQLTPQVIETQLSKSMHVFQRFVQHEATHPFDTLAVQLIRESMELSLNHLPSNMGIITKQEQENLVEYLKHHQDLSTSPLVRQVVEMISDVRHYRSLHGLILQNCSTIHPITDIHLIAHENSTFSEQICQALNVKNFQQQATRKNELLQLSMKGMGAFAIHNCMNHSCEPTAVSVSDQNNHVLSVYAHHENGLKKMDEILISYVDENAPYEERKRKLLEQYKFECHCPKCERESKK
ncbi:hypothetical protein C9374_002839 [Naegleria lovaniensis]|uniref:SET domain-containing protein n=1 Tax=Naegleria lovaniensis TaxID=51637 RepID=A0AA88KL51_NAELO|nr:uncharacterized protein C9374_002839 [Naegleria lovaniensis]KAG2386393.1 hypothetical protein C9374_002839 [Naegleria lovaniensis]